MKQMYSNSTASIAHVHRVIGVLSLIILATTYGGVPAGSKKAASSSSPAAPKATSPQGYLGKSSPMGLRFAPPPKPPVAYLPPLPITYDPQPVFSSDFAPPTTELPAPQPSVGPAPPPAITNVAVTILASNFVGTNRNGQIPASPVDLGSVSPQMLVRFFPNGRIGQVELFLTNGASFNVPVREDKRSSSASYEVR
ncbi:MAG: hypothetical protein HY735_11300 [Verrucomicrobia bacterium]|nr:hypothetical protein [Verrucomicrobiota bacterium]